MQERGGTILVTGGCGFIGTHLCHALVNAGQKLRVLDDLSTGKAAGLPHSADLILGDVADADAVATAMQGVDGVVHLAAIASVEKCNNAWVASHRTNLTGSLTVMQAARDVAPVPVPVVWASSAAIYGAARSLPISERVQGAPQSPYGADKLASELHGAAAAEVFGLASTALRFFNVYGPGQDPHSPYSGVISIFADRLARGDDIIINGDGQQTRDFVYVGDVVQALDAALDRLIRRRRLGAEAQFDAVNVCTGRAVTVTMLAETLRELTGSTGTIAYGPARNGDIRDSVGDAARMQRLLGIRAQTRLEEGLRALIQAAPEKIAQNG